MLPLDYCLKHGWPVLLLWMALYVSDYYLTLLGARLGKESERHIGYKKGYELTPQFREDINSFRKFSPRFAFYFVLSTVFLAGLWYASVRYDAMWGIELMAGYLLLLEATVHLRHIRNIRMFQRLRRSDGVEGRIVYSMQFSLSNSADELFTHAVLYLLLAGLTERWFFLGGAIACYSTGINHLDLARKERETERKDQTAAGEGKAAETREALPTISTDSSERGGLP